MKILRISGENLTSLEKFELDLTRDEFNHSGLFAITGPTGSGKSTLLDSICLALYAKTPRYTNHGGASIGYPDQSKDSRITANDPRSLLSHGAGSARAEVDFIGVNRKIYRAIWSVRRARMKASGKFQTTKFEFYELHEDQTEKKRLTKSTRRETKSLIESKIGLNFDQFCRSVFLAQGEFDAFLKAEQKDRGELLQKMTGTEIYAQLSRAAFNKCKLAKNELNQYEEERGELNLLTDDQVREVRRSLKEIKKIVSELDKKRQELEREHMLFDRLQLLQTRHQENIKAHQELTQKLNERREEFDKAKRLKELYPLTELSLVHQEMIKRAQTLKDELDVLEDEQERHDEETAQLIERYTRAQEYVNDLKHQWFEGEESRQHLNTLESKQVHLQQQLASKERVLETKDHERLALTDLFMSSNDQLREAHDNLRDDESWLANYSNAKRLFSHKNHWRDLIERFQENQREQETTRGQLNDLQQDIDQSQKNVLKKTQELDHLGELLIQVEKDLDELPNDYHDAQPRLIEKEATLRSEIDQLKEVEQLLNQWAIHYQTHQEYKARQEEQEHIWRTLEENQRDQQINQIKNDARLEEVQRNWEIGDQQNKLIMYRDQLRDGEPCPLCGSREHPGVEDKSSELQQTLKKRLDELRTIKDQLDAESHQIEKRLIKAKTEAESIQERAHQIKETLQDMRSRWDQLTHPQELFAQIPSLHPDHVETIRHFCEEKIDQANKSLSEVRHSTKHTFDLLHKRTRSEDRRSEILQKKQEVIGKIELFKERQNMISQKKDQLSKDQARLLSECHHLSDQLNQYGYMEEGETVQIATEKTLEKWLTLAENWNIRFQRVHVLKQTIEQDERKKSLLQSELNHVNHNREELIKERDLSRISLSDIDHELNSLASEKQAMNTLEEELKDAQIQLKVLKESHEAVLEDQKKRHLILEQKRVNTREQYVRVEEGKHRFQAELQLYHSTEEEIQHIQQELRDKHSLQELERKIDQRAVFKSELLELNAKISSLAEEISHVQTSLNKDHKAEEMKTDLNMINEELQKAQHSQFTYQTQLKKHEDAINERGELDLAYLRAKKELTRWKMINDVIGSSTGIRFRNFAQNLTLEMILEHANFYLESLMSRYKLMRIFDQDLEFQVIDQDFGDEARSLHSLSGGERFLISLALALGLSSTSAQNIQIESLFIDEGFGTLDPTSLDIALSVLDNLQAKGRQIGLISHVDGLAERVGTEVVVKPIGGGKSSVYVRQRL